MTYSEKTSKIVAPESIWHQEYKGVNLAPDWHNVDICREAKCHHIDCTNQQTCNGAILAILGVPKMALGVPKYKKTNRR